jgi:hypothetical protein
VGLDAEHEFHLKRQFTVVRIIVALVGCMKVCIGGNTLSFVGLGSGMSQRRAAPATHDTRVLHAQVRRDIEAYRRRMSVRERDAAEASIMRPQTEAKELVAFGCQAVDSLLDRLTAQTKAEELAEAQLINDVVTSYEREAEVVDGDVIDEVATLRALASDDTSLETSSVPDYSAEPPPAPGYTSDSIIAIRDELEASHRKMCESAATLQSILLQAPHWWTSPVVTRRLKTHTIRIDYHARKFRKWSNQGRAHLFVSSSILNRAGQEATVDLHELRMQYSTYQKRVERLREKQRKLQKLSEEILRVGEELGQLNERLSLPMVLRASTCAKELVSRGDGPPPRVGNESAETILLLAAMSRVFPELAPHSQVIANHVLAGQ